MAPLLHDIIIGELSTLTALNRLQTLFIRTFKYNSIPLISESDDLFNLLCWILCESKTFTRIKGCTRSTRGTQIAGHRSEFYISYPFRGFTLEANRAKVRVKCCNIFHNHPFLAYAFARFVLTTAIISATVKPTTTAISPFSVGPAPEAAKPKL